MNGGITDVEIDALADRVCSAFKTIGRGNTVRFPVNAATVSNVSWWTKYKRLIDRVIGVHGMKVILAYWEASNSKDGRVDNSNNWKKMWMTIDAEYGNNPMVYMEPMNEPHGYSRNALLDLYRDFRRFMTNLPAERTICDGTGYSQNVAAIGDDPRVAGCLFSFHLYHWFGSQTGEQGWTDRFNRGVGKFASRTIVTEWGSECTQGHDYSMASSDNKISYIRAMSRRINELKMGSVYWPGIRDYDDWFRIFDSSANPTTVTNQSMLERIHLSFGDTSSAGSGGFGGHSGSAGVGGGGVGGATGGAGLGASGVGGVAGVTAAGGGPAGMGSAGTAGGVAGTLGMAGVGGVAGLAGAAAGTAGGAGAAGSDAGLPAAGGAVAPDPAPRASAAIPQEQGCGCSVPGGRGRKPGWQAWLLAALGAALVVRRRRKPKEVRTGRPFLGIGGVASLRRPASAIGPRPPHRPSPSASGSLRR